MANGQLLNAQGSSGLVRVRFESEGDDPDRVEVGRLVVTSSGAVKFEAANAEQEQEQGPETQQQARRQQAMRRGEGNQ